MDPKKLFADTRLLERCILCGGRPSTRDHAPPKIFLDDPLPDNLPVVSMCRTCNTSASADVRRAAYVACAIDVARCGGLIGLRSKVAAALTHSPGLATRLHDARRIEDDHVVGVEVDVARFTRVFEKIGRGLMAYADGDPHGSDPNAVWSVLEDLSPEATKDFLDASPVQFLPEIGSRSFVTLFGTDPSTVRWTSLQPGRFSYMVDRTEHGTEVRMLLSDYVVARCTFNS